MRAVEPSPNPLSNLNEEQQELIARFLEPAFRAIDTATLTTGLKVIALRAMMGEIEFPEDPEPSETLASEQEQNSEPSATTLTPEQEQKQDLIRASIMPYIKMVRALVARFGVSQHSGNCFLDSPDILGILFYATPNQNLTQESIQQFIHSAIHKKINQILPPLKKITANIYVHAVLHGAWTHLPLNQIYAIFLYAKTELGENTCFGMEDARNILNSSVHLSVREALDEQLFLFKKMAQLAKIQPTINTWKMCIIDAHGNIDIDTTLLAFFKENGYPPQLTARKMYKNNYPQCARWLLDRVQVDEPSGTLIDASKAGDLPMLAHYWEKTASELRSPLLTNEDFDENLFLLAILKSHLHIVSWLWEKATEEERASLLLKLIKKSWVWCEGKAAIPVFDWLWEKIGDEQKARMLSSTTKPSIFYSAASNGRLDAMLWFLQKINSEQISQFIEDAITRLLDEEYGTTFHLHVIKWFWARATDTQKKAILTGNEYTFFGRAAYSDYLSGLEWFKEKSTAEEFSEMLMDSACVAFTNQQNQHSAFQVRNWLWQNANPAQQHAMLMAAGCLVFQQCVYENDLVQIQWLWEQTTPEQHAAMLSSNMLSSNKHELSRNPDNLRTRQWLWEVATPEQQVAMLEASGYSGFDDSLKLIFPSSPSLFNNSSQKRLRENSDEKDDKSEKRSRAPNAE